MSSIYLDPVGMDATAGAVGEHAGQVEDAVATLETAGSAYVPPHLAGWLADELQAIVLACRLSALVYRVAALDTALRAQQISADQSLATAWPTFDAPLAETSTPYDVQVALAGSSVVGGTVDAFTSDFLGPDVSVVGGAEGAFTSDFLGPDVSVVGGTEPLAISDVPVLGPSIVGGRLAGSRPGMVDPQVITALVMSELSKTPSAPDGLSYVPSTGGLADQHGRSGVLSQTYRDPRTGALRF